MDTTPTITAETQHTEEEKATSMHAKDDDGYFNDFSHHVGSERRLNSEEWNEHVEDFERSTSGQIRKSTEEFLRMKRDEFWATHKESIEERRVIDEMAEIH